MVAIRIRLGSTPRKLDSTLVRAGDLAAAAPSGVKYM